MKKTLENEVAALVIILKYLFIGPLLGFTLLSLAVINFLIEKLEHYDSNAPNLFYKRSTRSGSSEPRIFFIPFLLLVYPVLVFVYPMARWTSGLIKATLAKADELEA